MKPASNKKQLRLHGGERSEDPVKCKTAMSDGAARFSFVDIAAPSLQCNLGFLQLGTP